MFTFLVNKVSVKVLLFIGFCLVKRLGLIPPVDIHHSQGYVRWLIQLGCN